MRCYALDPCEAKALMRMRSRNIPKAIPAFDSNLKNLKARITAIAILKSLSRVTFKTLHVSSYVPLTIAFQQRLIILFIP